MPKDLTDRIEETIEVLSNIYHFDKSSKELLRAMCSGCFTDGSLAAAKQIRERVESKSISISMLN